MKLVKNSHSNLWFLFRNRPLAARITIFQSKNFVMTNESIYSDIELSKDISVDFIFVISS